MIFKDYILRKKNVTIYFCFCVEKLFRSIVAVIKIVFAHVMTNCDCGLELELRLFHFQVRPYIRKRSQDDCFC